MKKFFLIAAASFIVVIASVLVARFLLGGDEDVWICVSGQWVKHGNPSSAKPEDRCGPAIVQKTKDQLEDMSVCYSPNGNSMSYAQAKEKAPAGCDGVLQEDHYCDDTTGMWWIDFVPTTPRKECYPACIVDVDTGSAKVDWRCGEPQEPSV